MSTLEGRVVHPVGEVMELAFKSEHSDFRAAITAIMLCCLALFLFFGGAYGFNFKNHRQVGHTTINGK